MLEAVIFDFHSTLVDNGNPQSWVLQALLKRNRTSVDNKEYNKEMLLKRFEEELIELNKLSNKGKKLKLTPDSSILLELFEELNNVWEHAKIIDPDAKRDLGTEQHRQVFEQIMLRLNLPQDLINPLYEALPEEWKIYEDVIPTLKYLKEAGKKLGLISNVGFDIRPILEREKIIQYFDSIILSYEIGITKPNEEIFKLALNELNIKKKQSALMVGDDCKADGGACTFGIPTLLIPKTFGTEPHGLSLVTKIIS